MGLYQLLLSKGSFWLRQKSVLGNFDDGWYRFYCFSDGAASTNESIGWRESNIVHGLTFFYSLCITLWFGLGNLGALLKCLIWSYLCSCETCYLRNYFKSIELKQSGESTGICCWCTIHSELAIATRYESTDFMVLI
ncbi:hypothetical protein CsatA_009545 [Cannabis sativa]